MQFSYFYLQLLSHLKDSHPHLVDDSGFIADRVDLASITYEQERLDGSNHDEAMEQVNDTLFRGLHFSVHDVIFKIIEELYTTTHGEKYIRTVASRVYNDINPDVLNRYKIEDNFDETPGYEFFYIEMIGEVYSIIGDYGI